MFCFKPGAAVVAAGAADACPYEDPYCCCAYPPAEGAAWLYVDSGAAAGWA